MELSVSTVHILVTLMPRLKIQENPKS